MRRLLWWREWCWSVATILSGPFPRMESLEKTHKPHEHRKAAVSTTGGLHVCQHAGRISKAFQVLRAHGVRHAEQQVGHGLRAVLDVTPGGQRAAAAARQNERQVRVGV